MSTCIRGCSLIVGAVVLLPHSVVDDVERVKRFDLRLPRVVLLGESLQPLAPARWQWQLRNSGIDAAAPAALVSCPSHLPIPVLLSHSFYPHLATIFGLSSY